MKTWDQFVATIKPGMLDANGRFKGPQFGVNYLAEGMTPGEFFTFITTPIGDPTARDGADRGVQPRGFYLNSDADATWIPGPIGTGDMWTVPLAILAIPFAASALGIGAETTGAASAAGGATGAGLPSWSTVKSGLSTVNQISSGAALAQKFTSGAPVSGLDVLQGAGIVAGAGDYLSSNFSGVSSMDVTVTDVYQSDANTWVYQYSDGTMQMVDTSGATTFYDANGNYVPPFTDLQVTDVSQNANGTWTYTYNDGSTTTVNADGSLIGVTNQYQQPVSTPAVVTSTDGFSWASVNKTIQTVSSNVAQAINTIAAVKRIGQPPILSGQTVMQNGASVTYNRNGTITRRLPNGQTSIVAMPTGQPYAFSDGSAVVNNGNGTFTTINPDGTMVNGNMPPVSGGGISSNTLLLAALGIGALLVLKK